MPFDQMVRTTLGELCERQGGAIQTGPFGSQLHASDYTSEGTPVVMPADILGGRISTAAIARVGSGHVERLSQHQLRLDDIVFSRRGDVTRYARVTSHEVGWLCGTGCLKVRVGKGSLATPQWISLALGTADVKEWLVRHAVGATMPNLNTTILGSLPLVVPPLSEQRNAVDICFALDDRIDLLRQTNATLESIAQTLFKSWFIDFDPVRAKAEGREPLGLDAATAALFPAEFEESTPAGWRMGTLETLCSQGGGLIQTGPFGSQLHASDYEDQGLPVVMPQDLDGRRISTDRVARVSVAHVERLARHKLQPGDVVFSRRGDVGRHAAVTEVEAGWLCGTGCLLVRPGPRWPSPAYVSQALATPEATDWLKRHAVGATMPNLNTGILEALPMLLPSNPVLAAFESVCGALEARITKNRAQALALSELRDTLLPRLISGKLRLPEAQALMESTP
jgi:type I restriction enzyme S subunit